MAASLPLAAPAADAPVHATAATQAADAAFRAIYETEWAWPASEFGFAADKDEKGGADMPGRADVGPAPPQSRLAGGEDMPAQESEARPVGTEGVRTGISRWLPSPKQTNNKHHP